MGKWSNDWVWLFNNTLFLLISLIVLGHLKTLTWQLRLLSCSLELHLLSTGFPRIVTANQTDDLRYPGYPAFRRRRCLSTVFILMDQWTNCLRLLWAISVDKFNPHMEEKAAKELVKYGRQPCCPDILLNKRGCGVELWSHQKDFMMQDKIDRHFLFLCFLGLCCWRGYGVHSDKPAAKMDHEVLGSIVLLAIVSLISVLQNGKKR